VALGRGIGEEVQPAMNIGIFLFIGLAHAVEDCARLLGGGGIVEIDERLAVDFARKNGKVRADPGHVVGAVGDRRMQPVVHGGYSLAESQLAARAISASRTLSCPICCNASPKNA